MTSVLDPAVYVLYDELYPITERTHALFSERTALPVRILGRLSTYQADCNIAEIVSPTKGDALPSIMANTKFLSDTQKSNLANESNRERLVQLIGELTLSTDRFSIIVFSSVFMDGVDLALYQSVARLTRSLVKHLPQIELT